MATVLVAEGCRELDIGRVRHFAGMHGRGREYSKGGIFRDLTESEARQVVKHCDGYIVPPGGPSRAPGGFRCVPCNRLNHFKICGRCGGEGEPV